MKKHIVFLFSITFGLLNFAPLLHAEEQGACREDAQKLCAGVEQGEGRIHDCLKSHQGELSADCKKNMTQGKEKMHAHREKMMSACEADLKQYCSNVTPGEGRPMMCLKAYEDKISAACRDAMPNRMKMRGDKHHGSEKKNTEHPPTPPTK